MVFSVSENYLERNFDEVERNRSNYIFLDVKDLKQQAITFERVVEVLGLINEVNRINTLCKGLNSKLEFEDKVLYEVIKAIYKNEPLSNVKLVEYINLRRQLENINVTMSNFTEVGCSLSSLTEYFIFGLEYEKYEKLSNRDSFNLEKEFDDIFYNESDENIVCSRIKNLLIRYKNIELVD
ncbi:hypothetical protein ACG2LH_15760 [Zhouia sp. PK063]|uniref:hypothetical protein n=1 Tax=Zhouia sp. PK063 TaxID=3373602 RepID=UPI0037AE00DC